MYKQIEEIHGFSDITGIVPGVHGQRAFPTLEFKKSDPFLMLDHIGPKFVGKDFVLDGKGHDHPHRGFETLTFMFEGRLDHRDSIGNQERLDSGSVQRMNAGSGIIHGGSMYSDQQTERYHGMQLWIDNPIDEKMSDPEIHNVSKEEIPILESDKSKLRVISGDLKGLSGPINTKAETRIGHLIFDQKGSMEVEGLEPNWKVMVYVMEGKTKIQDEPLEEFQLAVLSNDGVTLKIDSDGPAQALILAGIPLNQPVAFGGPFVMTSEEEIQQAYLDFQLGKFGQIV